jgi:pyruvate,water dikinase
MADRFPTPSEVPAPEGAEDWRSMYPYGLVFSEDRKEYENDRFWFTDSMHWPDPLPPWDASLIDVAFGALSQYNSRVFIVPPANGLSARLLNGYVYLSPVAADPAEIEARAGMFMERAGHYFMNWNDLYDNWMTKVRALVGEIEALEIEPLPDVEEMDVVTKGRGLASGYDLYSAYLKIADASAKIWSYHFEFLNLGYAAYLDFFGFCKTVWPNIPDLAIAKMVAGVEVDLFRPDEELKRLARLAVESGVAEAFASGDVDATCETLKSSPAGTAWIESFQESAEPWFNFSTGSGFYHKDKIWIENVEVPFDFIKNYIDKLQQGEDLARPLDAIHAERDRIVNEYMDLLDSDEDREAFQGKLGLSRVVFPYVENHNFYVEHWTHSVIWRKMRNIGQVFVKEGFIEQPDDIFYMTRGEIPDALADLYTSWAAPEPARGPHYWPPIIKKRRAMNEAMKKQKPPPALGTPPEVITEPFTVMLWGVTSESVNNWLGADGGSDGTLKGMSASPGMVEGTARVIFSPDQISEIQDGEILVAPLTAPSWAPIFGKISATVTDTGGMMSHAAIVCREYGLPAVTGTSSATTTIKTGDRIRVDGSTGTVTLL